MTNIQENIQNAKQTLTDSVPTPPSIKSKSSPNDLLKRLKWGEPALTIIDVRSREASRNERITGAMCMPCDCLVEQVQGSLEKNRDIYIYGDNNEETACAADSLRQAGFRNVAELEGGLQGWKAISGPTEGTTMSV